MDRRDFLAATTAATASLAFGVSSHGRQKSNVPAKRRFALNYAPHFGMFKNLAGDDPVDQVKFMADEGFTALQDNGLKRRPKELQERIRKEMDRHGMTMGVFVATADFGNPSFTSGRADLREKVLRDIRESLDVAERMNAKWMSVVPGKFDHRLPLGYQTAKAIELLRRCTELCEPRGVVMVLEPLNHWANHPQLFLRSIRQACRLCRAVDSPSCKILFDIYHQQITEGNLVPSIDAAWDEIAYFQVGDTPGRKEPGTGQIGFHNVLGHIHQKGCQGVLGMEHGNGQPGADGEQAVIDAYVKHDPESLRCNAPQFLRAARSQLRACSY